jgi:methionyl-tRNA synthetase
MIERYRDGLVPTAEVDPRLARGEDGLAGIEGSVAGLLDEAELTQGLEAIWARVRRLNRYVEESRPWDLAKDPALAADLDRVLYNLAEGVRVLALLLRAYMPETSTRLLAALAEERDELAAFGSRAGGQRIERIPALFPKLAA